MVMDEATAAYGKVCTTFFSVFMCYSKRIFYTLYAIANIKFIVYLFFEFFIY